MKNLLILIISLLVYGCQPTTEAFKTDFNKILWAADWSPDGKHFAVGGNYQALKIYSGENYKLIKNLPYPNTITKLKWHPTESLLAIATQTSTQKSSIYNYKTGESIPLDSISEVGARSLGWSSDGQLLAVGDLDGYIHIFNKKGKHLKKMDCEQKTVTGLSWHPTKNIIATVGFQIAIYDVDNNQIQKIKPRPVDVLMLSVAWHPSGDFFVTGDYGDYIENYPALLQFWNADGENIRNIEKSKAEYRNLVWSKNGERLATASDALRIWSKEGKLLRIGKSKRLLWGIDWNSDDTKLVTCNIDGGVVIWNKKSKVLRQFEF